MKKIVHIITGLNHGGAENMMFKLLKYSDRSKYYHEVISLTDGGHYGEKIEDLGIKVHHLNLPRTKNFFGVIRPLLRLRAICANFDTVDTWLYQADLFGFVVAKLLLRGKKLLWNIRHSNLDVEANKPRTLLVMRINAYLSRYVDGITYNSAVGHKNHTALGYQGVLSVVIPNGFELQHFRFSPHLRKSTRAKLGLTTEKVIITVGRWNIQKDYYTLLSALGELRLRDVSFKMLMVGPNLDWNNKELSELIQKHKLQDNMILLGRQTDIAALLSAADLYVSSSLGESFSNAIGEAMACELYCIVTNVGDSSVIVGDAGVVIEPRDSNKLASYLQDFCLYSDESRCGPARARIMANYDMHSVVKSFENWWDV